MRPGDDRTYLEQEDKNIFPGKTFQKVILEPLFINAKDELLNYMMKINLAHAVMLAEEGIVSEEEIQKILIALKDIEEKLDWQNMEYDPKFEDLFFHIEGEMTKMVGEQIAGQLHTGRSRNDIDATLFRMVLREKALFLSDQLIDFRQVILHLVKDNINTIIPGYTHTQPAQPTTLAHYLIAVLDFLRRDFQRIREFYKRLNLSPMGAGALTTTSFPINRESIARFLGFDKILENSYDCVGGSDYLSEASSILIIMMTSLSRLLHDFLLYVMEEFNYLRLGDAYVQTSSIMPQKRNPVSLEYSRAMTTGILGQAQVVITMLINTPFGDIVDKEHELQSYLWHAWERSTELFKLLTVVFNGMEINKEALCYRTRESFAVVTQLAETIVQYTDLPFRSAHKIVSRVVKKVLAEGKKVNQIDGELVNQTGKDMVGKNLSLTDQMVRDALDPENFVRIRNRPGGPAPEAVEEQIKRCILELTEDQRWANEKREQIITSEELLFSKVRELSTKSY